MSATDNGGEHETDPYFLARLTVAGELRDFINSHSLDFTYAQGEPLLETVERLDTNLGEAHLSTTDHRRAASEGAAELREWLDEHGDEVSLQTGSQVAEMAEKLEEGTAPAETEDGKCATREPDV